MVSHPMKVAVIGAGPSGLAAIKELLAEGHSVKGFEKAPGLGGVFRFDRASTGVYQSCTLTSSTTATTFSDFPLGRKAAYFLTHSEYVEYLTAYAAAFGVSTSIAFGTTVLDVRRHSGKWRIASRDSEGNATEETFDAVAVCAGLHQNPRLPQLFQEDKFHGTVSHSGRYKDADCFRGKRVLILGAGESGADIIDEVSRVASSCSLSLRRGVWVLPRLIGGVPNDFYTSRLFYSLPEWLLRANNPAEQVRRYRRLSAVLLGPVYIPFLIYESTRRLLTKWRRRFKRRATDQPQAVLDLIARLRKTSGGGLAEQFVTKSERFAHAIVEGRCHLKPDVVEVEANSVTFSDGTQAEFDCVLCCTGYQTAFPFLDPEIRDIRKLYLSCFVPSVGGSLCIIGAARPATGSIPPIAEMQSRLFAQTCSGRIALPTEDEMIRDAALNADAHKRRFGIISDRLDHLVDYTSYMDRLATILGCKPKLSKLLRHPGLLYKIYGGHFSCAQFRLFGPHCAPLVAAKELRNLQVGYSLPSMAFMFMLLAATKVYGKLGVKFLSPHLRLD